MSKKKGSLADFVPKSKIERPRPEQSVEEWIAEASENQTLEVPPATESARQGATKRPADVRKPKKIVIRATEDFHRTVKAAAADRGVSMEDLATLALERLLGESSK